jgi:CheY-like chemotaxis protein
MELKPQTEETKLTVIIAEDDDAAAHLIKTNLRRAGLESDFIRTKNGEETLKILENGSVPQNGRAILLLDVRMPKVDGIRVLKYVKSSAVLRKLPVIMLTTSDRPKEVEICYRLGCNAYLKKQVDYSRFVDSIKKLASFIKTVEIPFFGEFKDE